jgi:meso-butanediol dehydrogenase/(S,S)-butanediol dehydrogenase/diacetyl reductase
MSAKGGLLQLSRALAIDYADQNIRVNAISPGWTATPMNAELRNDPNYMKTALRGPLIKRPALPEEIAGAAVYLASDEAAYVTGANIVIDGGWTLRSALSSG